MSELTREKIEEWEDADEVMLYFLGGDECITLDGPRFHALCDAALRGMEMDTARAQAIKMMEEERERAERLERIAVFLWDLLDAIDTLDDACKDNDVAFRKMVYKRQQRRHEVATTDGYNLTFKDEALRKEGGDATK
jgi:hypothetical protein